MIEHLPVFVYGTLRPGGSNEHVFGPARRTHLPAVLAGFEMVTNASYPYILAMPTVQDVTGQDAGTPLVQGTLVFVDSADWASTAARLDALEGTDPQRPIHDGNLYNRVQLTVTTEDGAKHLAWVYVPPASAQPTLRQRYPLVPGNDWLAR